MTLTMKITKPIIIADIPAVTAAVVTLAPTASDIAIGHYVKGENIYFYRIVNA